MFNISDLDIQEERLEETIKNLDLINFQIAELKELKEQVEKKLVRDMNLVSYDDNGSIKSVAHDGEQSKIIGKYKVKIKTPSLWKINAKEYQIVKSRLRQEFDPVKQSVTYRVDKKVLETIKSYGSNEDQEMIESFLTLDYSKPSITLTLNA